MEIGYSDMSHVRACLPVEGRFGGGVDNRVPSVAAFSTGTCGLGLGEMVGSTVVYPGLSTVMR